ncbi:hypothetical protein B7T06_06320 [Cronobacter sakazakii]|uniref:phage tail termination protein n=1 Tax=Cronobacter sakazakii TaxID=28141 RepID=UPI000A16350A|nr:hypothetical protein [Cronobacter sakazakii]KAB0849159.1 hypothetical protein FZI10_12135 [Cronobacter sakazakii]PUV97465.1 hypothetical protein B7T06_06320 [Cronobacter sakazakii]
MTPSMYERVRNSFAEAGLTDGFLIQLLMYDDPGDVTKPVMVFRPNGGTALRKDLGSEHYVLVDIVGAKDKRKDTINAVQKVMDYVQQNPLADDCLGYIENVGGIPPPVLTEEGRMYFRLQFACNFGD